MGNRNCFAAGLAVLALGLAACGDDDELELTTPVPPAIEVGATGATGASGPTVDGSAIESAVEDSIDDPGFSLDCPESVSVEDGNKFRCDLIAGGEAGNFEIEIDGDSLNFAGGTKSGAAEYSGKGIALPETAD